MAFRTLITNQVNNAFNLIDDLAETITFTNNSVSEYDFESGEATESNIQTIQAQGVISKIERSVENDTLFLAEVILKSSDFTDVEFDVYDVVRFRSKDWNIYNIDNNGFAIILTASRKV